MDSSLDLAFYPESEHKSAEASAADGSHDHQYSNGAYAPPPPSAARFHNNQQPFGNSLDTSVTMTSSSWSSTTFSSSESSPSPFSSFSSPYSSNLVSSSSSQAYAAANSSSVASSSSSSRPPVSSGLKGLNKIMPTLRDIRAAPRPVAPAVPSRAPSSSDASSYQQSSMSPIISVDEERPLSSSLLSKGSFPSAGVELNDKLFADVLHAPGGSKGFGLAQLVQLCNQLKHITRQLYGSETATGAFQFPEICVVGEQSSGKSSVLESILRKDFLPKGSGTVTRRPLEMTVCNRQGREEVVFGHKPDQPFTDLSQVTTEIKAATDALCGRDRSTISAVPIVAKFYSPHVYDLTFVDLPGRVTEQEMSKDIDDMIFRYIEPKKRILLAVHPAVQELHNSAALAMCARVDPMGSRTICVLTKTDLIAHDEKSLTNLQELVKASRPDISSTEEGKKILGSQAFQCQHGYIPVVCRASDDLKSVDPEQAAENEATFFSDPANKWSDLQTYCGTHYLNTRLQALLLRDIQESIPVWRREIAGRIEKLEEELALYLPLNPAPQDIEQYILREISRFSVQFKAQFIGDLDHADVRADRAAGIAQLENVFHQNVIKVVSEPLQSEDLKAQQIQKDIRDSGHHVGAVFNRQAFSRALDRIFKSLFDKLLPVVDKISDRLLRVLEDCKPKTPYDSLNSHLLFVAQEHIDGLKAPAHEFIKNLITIQREVSLLHPEFSNQKRDAIINRFMGIPGSIPPPVPSSKNYCEVPASRHAIMALWGDFGKFHCKNCGIAVCSLHSQNLRLLPHLNLVGPQKVCDPCVQRLAPQIHVNVNVVQIRQSQAAQNSSTEEPSSPASEDEFLGDVKHNDSERESESKSRAPANQQQEARLKAPLLTAPKSLSNELANPQNAEETVSNMVACTQEMCRTYYAIISQELADVIFKAMHTLVIVPAFSTLKTCLEHQLITSGNNESQLRQLVQEHPGGQLLRERKLHELQQLRTMKNCLKSV